MGKVLQTKPDAGNSPLPPETQFAHAVCRVAEPTGAGLFTAEALRFKKFRNELGEECRLVMYDHEKESLTAMPRGNACKHHPWYAIRVQAKFEKVASAVLRQKGFEEFLPLYRAKRYWSDRVKELDLPLFPGYLFCRLDVAERLLPVVTTPGVLGIVSAGRDPVSISDREIELVRTVVRSGLPAMPWPALSAGSLVLIEHGPLAGVEGVVLDIDKKCRLIVSVSMLQRSVAVEVEREWVRPLGQAA